MTVKARSAKCPASISCPEQASSQRGKRDVTECAGLSPLLTLLLSVACALAVANVYLAQPLLDSMAKSLDVDSGRIGLVVTATQTGYAIGLLLLVPLGDLVNRKRLVLSQILLSAIAVAAVGAAQGWLVLLSALIAVGLMATVVQVLVAYAAALSTPQLRGQAIGTVTSAIVLGILLARFVSGLIADLADWRTVYYVSSGLLLTLATLLWKALPQTSLPRAPSTYRALILSVFELLLNEPVLRLRGVLAMLVFAAFSVLWTALVLPLSAPPFYLSHTVIGLFGFAGVAGALAARRAGRWADKGFGQRVTGSALVVLTLSWLPISQIHTSLALFALGVMLLDFAVQAVHVTNQSLIVAVRPEAQSRMIGAYMCFYAIGSALGGVAATLTYARSGWPGVSVLGAAISAAALLVWCIATLRSTVQPGRSL